MQQQQPTQAESDMQIINAIRGFMDRDTRLMPNEINTFVACGEFLNRLSEAAKNEFIKAQQTDEKPAKKKPAAKS